MIAALVLAATIRWEPFELPRGASGLTAQLGRITVPLRRSKPDAGNVELAFVRLQTAGQKKAAPIVYLAGGPGASGVGAARNPYAMPSLTRLAQIADVILLDQRGIGMSTPRPACAPVPREPFSGEPGGTAKGVDVAGFTVAESAEDVDDLRKALGAPKISLLAHSYGTFLSLAVIRAHPDAIKRAALMGTAGPNHMRKLPLVLDAQLAKLSILAREDKSIGSEVPDMTALLKRVLEKLDREPIPVTITDQTKKEKCRCASTPTDCAPSSSPTSATATTSPSFPRCC